MTLLTSRDAPPVPFRDQDWSAWVDGQEELATGYGATAAEAVADLQERLEVRGLS